MQTLAAVGRKGAVAADGFGTIVQGYLKGFLVMSYPAKRGNANFYPAICHAVPVHLKETAQVIMGLSNNNDLLDDHATVWETVKAIQAQFQACTEKFYQSSQQLKRPEQDIEEIFVHPYQQLPFAFASQKRSAAQSIISNEESDVPSKALKF